MPAMAESIISTMSCAKHPRLLLSDIK